MKTYFCKYCGEQLFDEGQGVWVDITGGDCCSGDDNFLNENEPHVAKEEGLL